MLRLFAVSLLLASPKPVLPAAALPPDAPVALANAGFERPGDAALPSGWSLDGALPAGARAQRFDGGHDGRFAVELGAEAPASLTLRSEPVSLRVGHAYRLTGWVRTQAARADPLARYPTAVAATLSMASFPFTNHAPALAGTREWTRVETTFIATAAQDRVALHLGRNGGATGRAWFDDVTLAELGDVRELIPLERVRWEGPAFRYDDRGWIYVHVEGAPYARGRQFGRLVGEEIAAYVQKLSIRRDSKDPAHGWGTLRTLADALMLRRYDAEFLDEMKGIADGAAADGAEVHGRKLDLLDVVTINSAIDLDAMEGALPVTPSGISGRTFSAQDELALPDRLHKCSSLTATGPATTDGKPVFFQIFMWDGYTGLHFNVMLDVQPERGHRFVMQTFPGGIHSGTDFYMSDAGLVVGETTVLQTPFDPDGTPQSNRIRKAVQYASTIDELAAILREKNNGMYTNDWTLADVKRNEAAILLLGTKQSKLWRSTDQPAPFGTPGFLWANNNAREAAVRREVAAQPEDAPYDSTFTPANRDLAFRRFYDERKGRIDVESVVRLMASSPINRPHACDGKVTDAAMAEKLVFMAHQGKVTLREKFPAAGSRRMPDLPGAVPHLTYGYATFSPIVIGEQLKAAKAAHAVAKTVPQPLPQTASAVDERYAFERERLWRGSIFPATDADNWLVAGSAAYAQLLRGLPEKADARPEALARALAGLRSRLAYVTSHEPDLAAVEGGVAYDRYGPALVPRIKGVFALHQLRLRAGNEAFFGLMRNFHARHRGQEVTTAQFLAAAAEALGRDVGGDLRPWIERTGLPDPVPTAELAQRGGQWRVKLRVTQPGEPYRLATSVAIDAGGKRHLFAMNSDAAKSAAEFTLSDRPTRVTFDALSDLPVATDRAHAFSSFAEDFGRAVIVYGTGRQLEANHTLALRFQSVLADGFSEVLPPVVQDAEADEPLLASHDLFVLGDPRDNALLARLLPQLPLEAGAGFFRFRGETYADERDGLYLALPSPFAKQRVLHVLLANSALQLHEMTKSYRPALPGWAVFRGEKPEQEGHWPVERFELALSAGPKASSVPSANPVAPVVLTVPVTPAPAGR